MADIVEKSPSLKVHPLQCTMAALYFLSVYVLFILMLHQDESDKLKKKKNPNPWVYHLSHDSKPECYLITRN